MVVTLGANPGSMLGARFKLSPFALKVFSAH